MKMEMTEKDKKLLVFLTIFVIVVGIGYWGILPAVKSINKTKDAISEQEALRDENDMKIKMLPEYEELVASAETKIEKYKSTFYPIMSSAEIDKYFTGLALDYNLYAYDLDINVSTEPARLDPYKYSEIAVEMEASGVDQDTKFSDEGTEGDFSDDVVGIYCAEISMRLGGEEKDLIRLINDLSDSKNSLRVVSFSWSDDRSVAYGEDEGDYEIVLKKTLQIKLEIYMCEE